MAKVEGISSFSEAKRRSRPRGGSVFRNAKAIRKALWMVTGLDPPLLTKKIWIAAHRKSWSGSKA
jgi:hypothetical protein